MLRPPILYSLFWVLFFAFVSPVWAENEGLADLDRATEIKINAEKQRDLTSAIELCESALAKGLDKNHTRFAKSLLASTLCERATLASDAAFARGPDDPLWLNYRSLALDDLEKAVRHVPELPDALLLIAKLNLLPKGDRDRAVGALDAALAIRGTETSVRSRLLLLRVELEEDNAKKLVLLDEAVELGGARIEPLRQRGIVHAELGHPERAAADFQKVLELDPEDAATYQELARVLAELKRFDEALVCVDKACQLDPHSAMPLTVRAQVHVAMQNLDAALHDLNEAMAMRPGNPYVLLLRASIYREMGKSDAALADIDRALRKQPDLEPARRLRWAVLIGQRKLDQVITEMEQQLRRTPNDRDILIQMAMLCTAGHQPNRAIELYSSVLAAEPDNVEALEGRANALLGIGKHAEAIADFNRAVKLGTEDSGTLNNLAWVLATSPDDALRDGRRAVELATKACELTEYKLAHVLSTLAAAYAETGDFKTAIKWSNQAIKVGGDDTEADVREAIEKELKSYENEKPWRERLSEGLQPGPEEKTSRGDGA